MINRFYWAANAFHSTNMSVKPKRNASQHSGRKQAGDPNSLKEAPLPCPKPLDLDHLKVWPLTERRSLSRIEQILIEPASAAEKCAAGALKAICKCAARITAARQKNASVILMYGAHLIKNGAMKIVNSLVAKGWITPLATNGAGTIHDWELACLGRTEESVRQNVETGTFGTWDETGRFIHVALLAGALRAGGYGRRPAPINLSTGVCSARDRMSAKSL